MRKLKLLIAHSLLLVMLSCASSKYTFTSIGSLMELEGTYVNENNAISQAFSFPGKNYSYATLDFEDNETLNVTLLTDSGANIQQTYKGKYNPKKNYFEMTFSNKRIIAIVFYRADIEKLRIGLDKDKKLQLNSFGNHSGFFFFIGGGGNHDYARKVDKIDKASMLFPVQAGNKYGYRDCNQTIVIKPEYDLALMFDHSVACVRKENKWALIDRENKQLTPFKYSKIDPFRGKQWTKAYIGNQVGMINRKGEEFIPAKYDKIEDFSNHYVVSVISRDSKYGFANSAGVILPAVFDRVEAAVSGLWSDDERRKEIPNYIGIVTIGEKKYLADSDGFLYEEVVKLWGNVEIIKESKIYYQQLIKENQKVQESIHKF